MKEETVLITGGSGLIGSRLTEMLLAKGYKVAHLSRTKRLHSNPKVIVYQWNLEKGYIDEEAIQKADYIINLAGTSVAEKRWTEHQKKLIIDSRVKALELLHQCLKKTNKKPKALISASATGFYGNQTGNILLTESDKAGTDFLAQVTVDWENATLPIQEDLAIRTVRLRIGIVLSESGGALTKIIQPIQLGLGGKLGSGRQYMPWIHIDDLCKIFLFCLENEKISGTFNAVSPFPVDNATFTKIAAKILNRPAFWVIPAFLIRIIFGEMSSIVLTGNNVSSEKIQKAGFEFEFEKLEDALTNLLTKKKLKNWYHLLCNY
jgi:uncharacterized protein (TIGR01777 family)